MPDSYHVDTLQNPSSIRTQMGSMIGPVHIGALLEWRCYLQAGFEERKVQQART